MEASPFLKRAGHAGKIPRVLFLPETFGQVLWPKGPGLIRVGWRTDFVAKHRVVRHQLADDTRRSDYPSIVGQPANRIRSLVVVNQLAGRRDSILQVIFTKREIARIFDKVKQMSVRPSELLRAIH